MSLLLNRTPSFLFLLLLLGLSFSSLAPARPVPKTTTKILTTSDNATWQWHDFSRLTNSTKGSHVSGLSYLKQYFHHFGYLQTWAMTMNPDNFTDMFDAEMESAVMTYQTRLGLKITGQLDNETVSTIMAPRCGMTDTVGPNMVLPRHYAYFNGTPRWNRPGPMRLTYAISTEHTIETLAHFEIRVVFARAFARWAAVIPVRFMEAEEYEFADVRVGFYKGNHGDGEPFDGVLGVLAHAFSPEDGRLHLDGAETWAVDFLREKDKAAVDLESVATHEIGHVLGLAHSAVKEAVMYPSLKPRRRKVDLAFDDVEGIQALYGSNPKFKYESSLQYSKSFANPDVDLPWTPMLSLLLLFFVSS